MGRGSQTCDPDKIMSWTIRVVGLDGQVVAEQQRPLYFDYLVGHLRLQYCVGTEFWIRWHEGTLWNVYLNEPSRVQWMRLEKYVAPVINPDRLVGRVASLLWILLLLIP